MSRAVAWRAARIIAGGLVCVQALVGCEAALGVGDLTERGGSGTASGFSGGSGASGGSAGGSTGSAGGSGTVNGAATGATTATSDGTTGIPCASDSVCQPAGGPGINKCSSDYQEKFSQVSVQLWASPVCIVPLPAAAGTGSCDPGTDPNTIHFCDGPDAPSSPGVCIAFNQSAPMTGQGVCFPKCTFGIDGSTAIGCHGHDACILVTYLLNPTNNAVQGIGYCQSACQTDADCSALGANYVCEVDIGDCTTVKVPRTKSIGQPCTAADQTAGACNCITGSTTTGFCSSSCVVGANPSTCPSGWVCDSGEPAVLDFGAGSPMVPLTKQTSGMLGVCQPVCTLGAGATCPGTSTCVAGTVAGPDCVPHAPLSCTPACSGKQCGADGCGGSCGNCALGTACNASGVCACVPQCAGRHCGSDGCGGSCGTCALGTTCSANGACVCAPKCSGKACGPDGCGGTCGTCASGATCASGVLSGTCQQPVGGACTTPFECVSGSCFKGNCACTSDAECGLLKVCGNTLAQGGSGLNLCYIRCTTSCASGALCCPYTDVNGTPVGGCGGCALQ